MRREKQAAARDPLIGQVFGGKYAMQRLIGRGGVGLVYLAEDTETQDEVVLKLLSPDWSRKPEAVRRFEREAERLGSVRHPNIVRLLDQGHDAGRAYLVMEYLEGQLLSDAIIDSERLDLRTFVPIAAQVLKGIGHAHSRGVMIRDIKPANIMLCERKGRANFVKILDFGLAKLLRDEQPVTEEHVLGTAGYLAPEIIQGESEIDLRVDVFALGALFYFMLAGRLPFEGDESATIFYKTIHDDPTPLHDVLPTDHAVPEGLIKLVGQCLSKNPDRRPDDANAIVEQLIDVVPASMFRLPKIGGAPSTGEIPKAAGYGNTGLVSLVGDKALTGAQPAVPVAAPAAGSAPVTLSDPSQDPQHTGPIQVADPPKGRGLVYALATAVVLLGGGLVYALAGPQDSSASTEASDGKVRVASTGPNASDHDATLAEIRRLLDARDLEAAGDLLETLRGPARETPALAGRVDRLDLQLKTATLMTAGEDFEAKGEVDAAIATYRDVLEADPTHTAAREKLVELTPDDTPPTGNAEDALASVDIGSRPLANLYIDGEARGTTPFKGKHTVGTHAVRMTARGFQAWEGEIVVRADGTEDLRVRLVGRGKGRRGAKDGGSAVAPEPVPPPTPDPVPDPKPTSEPAKKKGVFLPTKDESGKNGGGVFLPTKD